MVRKIIFLFLTILFLSDLSAQSQQGWIAHYTSESGGFNTIIRMTNLSFENAGEVRLLPYATDGSARESQVRVIEVAPGQTLNLDRTALSWVGEQISHILVDAPETVRISAAYQANSPDSMSAESAMRFQGAFAARLVPISGSSWFDGMAITNPNTRPAIVVLSAHDAMGNTLQSSSISVPADGKWLGVISTLFEGLEIGGYVQAVADAEVHFLALRGSLGGINPAVLTEVPLDHFQPTIQPLTWSNQIGRIVDRKCVGCHVEGGIGPFSLTHFEGMDSVKSLASLVVSEGSMPPWKASDDCLPLKGSTALDPLEKTMLLDWLANGAPEGDPDRALEPQGPLLTRWGLGTPDMVAQYQEPYDFQPGPDDYRCFPIPLNNTEELTLRAFDILPGNSEIVHHVLVFLETNQTGQQLDAREDGPGYTCFGGPGTGGFRLLAGWAPGMVAQVLSDDIGIAVPPGSTLIVQVHYHYSGRAGLDSSQIGLYFDEQPRDKELLYLPLVNTRFRIPPNNKNYLVTQSFTIPPGIDAVMHTIAPHMHLLGKSIWVDMKLPDGEELCVVDVPSWDFNWQRFYEFEDPLYLPSGATLTLNCIFDNSAENPNNPYSPPVTVGWGEETTDEMALAFIGITTNVDLGKREFAELLPTALTAPADLPELQKEGSIRTGARPSCCSPDKDRPWCPNRVQQQ